MFRSIFVWLTSLVSLSLPVAGLLAGWTHGNSLGPDASTDGGVSSNVLGPDGSGGDSTTGTEDAAFGDGGVACIEGGAGPKGTQLVGSATVSIVNLTDDDQVVYVNTAANTLSAVPALGGAPTATSVPPGVRRRGERRGLQLDGSKPGRNDEYGTPGVDDGPWPPVTRQCVARRPCRLEFRWIARPLLR